MNVTIPNTLIDMIERLTSRKFGIVVFVIYLACTGSVPKESHEITVQLLFAYLACETIIDLAYAIFGQKKEVKNENAQTIPDAKPVV